MTRRRAIAQRTRRWKQKRERCMAIQSDDRGPDMSSVAALLRRAHRVGIWHYDIASGRGTWSDEVFDLLDLPLDNDPPALSILASRLDAKARFRFAKAIKRALDRGETFEFDHRILGGDGTERCLRACGMVMGNEKRSQFVGSLEDVTQETQALEIVERQAAELAALKDRVEAENARLRELFDQAPVFVALGSTPDLRFEYVNRAYRNLVGDRKLVGKTVAEALPEIVSQGLIDVLMNVSRTGKPYIAHAMPMHLSDGEGSTTDVRYLTYIYQPIRNMQGRTTGVLCIGYDVTEQWKAEREAELLRAELMHSSRLNAMGTMAATLAHELNQPLTSLVMFAAGLARRLGDSADGWLGESIRAIQDEALRASEIVRKMRAIGSGHPVRKSPLDLHKVLTDAIRLPLSGCEDVQVTFDLKHTGSASGDGVQIQQVITNIVRNACEAMADLDAKWIGIGTRDDTDEIEVRVSDNGPGIPPELREHLFEGTQSAKEGGMGIGLAICRTIVEAHGGRIGADTSDDGGATFWFTLPRHGK
jgi:two-component system, LuxR family, sensor kinase FixL